MIPKHPSYTVLSKIGSGGQSHVFKAEQRNLGRFVALKVARDADSETAARLEQEGAALARVNSRYVVAVFNMIMVIFEGESRRCLVLEHIEGETLEARLARAPISVEETLQILDDLSLGLETLHETGILMRDFKAANSMITAHGARLIDLGFAKIAANPRLTALGLTPVSIAWASPEQLRGEDLDVRTDSYSFAVLAYRMLVGRMPYVSQGDAISLALMIVGNAPVPRPSEVAPHLPRALDAVLLRALARTRNTRYATPRDVVAALRSVLQPAPKLARTGRAPAREMRGAALVTLLTAMALVVSLVVLITRF